jgi:transposase
LDESKTPLSDEGLTLSDEVPTRNGKLSYEDIGLVVQMGRSGKFTQTQIAAHFKVSQGAISKILASFGDTRKLARTRLKAEGDRVARLTLKAIEVASERGDAHAGMELLDRLNIARKHRDESSGSAKVMIVVGNGGAQVNALPALPVIDVE